MRVSLDVAVRALLASQRHSWEQGTAMQALLEAGCTEWLIPMAYECANRQTKDGRSASIGITDGVTDPCSVGETMLYAARETGDETLRASVGRLRTWAMHDAPRAGDGTLYHLTHGCEMWSDSFYMLPPFLAALGEYDAALSQVEGLWKRLYDEKSGLVAHRYSEVKGRLTDPAHWGVGIGWTLQGLIRVHGLLPEDREDDRKRLQARMLTLIEALLPYMCPDGAFHNVVDDSLSFPEYNLSQMLACTLLRGIREGIFPERFKAIALSLASHVFAHVSPYGLLSPVCGAPTFDRPGIAPEAQAFLLLLIAETEPYQTMEVSR